MAMAQRAGLLHIQPFLKTSRVEKMTARRDHSRLHVLKEGPKTYLINVCHLKFLVLPPKVLAPTFRCNTKSICDKNLRKKFILLQ